MNLFDNIIQSQFNNFTGKQAQPQVPSFATPKAPRTTNYVAPNVPTPTAPKISQGVRNGGVAPGYEGTIDETQSPVFKAVQGAANLFTGIQKRLGETAQSDIDRKQQKMDQKGIQFADHLINKGYTKEQVFASLDELKKAGELQVSPNFSERLVGSLSNRMGEVQRTTERLANEPITTRLATGIPSYAGDVVGTAFEPVGALLSPVVQKVIEKTGQTQNVEEVGKWWEGVRQSNPNFADAIEGSLNVASLAPLSPKVTAPIKSGIKTIGTKTLQTAEKIAPNLANQAKKLTSQAEMGFRKQAEDIAVPKLSEMGMREKQKVTGNVIETKPGLFKKEELVRSPQEALAIEEVSRMLKEGKIKKGGTELQKSSAISDEINGLAEALKGRLDNTTNPVTISKPEVESFINDLATNVKKNPIMVGDMQESAYKIIQNLKDKLTKDTYTPSDLLEIRKQLDSDVQAFKGETVFDPKIENAFSSTLKEFRQGINNKVAELVPNAEVRSFLDRQSALYNAKDNVDLKWAKQANSTIGRVLSKIQSATGIPRTEIIEASTALGLLGASFASSLVTPLAIGATAVVGGKKAIGAILSPKNKLRIANILTKLDEAIKKNPKDADLLKAKDLFSKYNKNGGTPTNILRPSNNGSSNPQSIIKPKNESKVIKPTSSDTIPEGYFKNAFGEIQPLPSNKKGGFIKIPEIGKNPIVNKQTGETLNQAIEKLKKNNWSEKDIQKYKDAVLGKKENIVKKEGILDTVNPTGGLFVDYTPKKRANSIISSKDLTTLDKTLGKSPDDYITIYRGTVKGQKEMNPGDFVTDMPELAKSYAGGDKIVISKKVKYSDIIDSIDNGGANEYLYIPKEMQKWDNQPKSLSPQKTVKPLTPKKQSATMGDMETKKLIEEKRNTEYKKRVDNLIDLAKKHYENASGYNKFMRMNDGKKQFLSDLESNSGIEWSKSTDEGIKKIGIDPDKTVYIHSFYPKYVKGTGIAKDDFLSKMKEAMSYKLRPVKYFATSSFSEDGANFFDKLVKEGYLKRVTDTVSQYDEFPSFGIPDPVKKYKTGISSGMNVFELTDKILSYERKIDKEKLFEEAVRGKVIGKPSIYKMFGIK